MFGLSGEHLLILGAVILIFGPRKLPELGSSIGKALRNFKEGLNHPQSSGNVGEAEVKPTPLPLQSTQAPLNSLSELHQNSMDKVPESADRKS